MSKIFDRSYLTFNPSNTSPSKQLFSFPKDPRFPKPKLVPLKNPNRYHLDVSPLPKPQGRATSMGFGKRSNNSANISFDNPTPGPQDYCQLYDPVSESKGTTFGREARNMADHSKDRVPGVGNYDLPNVPMFRTLGFIGTMSKEKRITEDERIKRKLGPGAYDTLESFGTGNLKFKNAPTAVISPETRIAKRKSAEPGPATYNNLGKLAFGKEVLSTKGSPFTAVMSRGPARGFLRSSDQPGPGDYDIPTDFGVSFDRMPRLKNSVAQSFTSKFTRERFTNTARPKTKTSSFDLHTAKTTQSISDASKKQEKQPMSQGKGSSKSQVIKYKRYGDHEIQINPTGKKGSV